MNNTQKIGIVVNNIVNKSKTVLVESKCLHSKYKKFITKSARYLIHDEKNVTKIGDIVSIEKCAPISKKKNWKLKKIYKKI